MLPTERRNMAGQRRPNVGSSLAEIREGGLQIPCVPQDDRRHEQVQARSAVSLVLEGSLSDARWRRRFGCPAWEPKRPAARALDR